MTEFTLNTDNAVMLYAVLKEKLENKIIKISFCDKNEQPEKIKQRSSGDDLISFFMNINIEPPTLDTKVCNFLIRIRCNIIEDLIWIDLLAKGDKIFISEKAVILDIVSHSYPKLHKFKKYEVICQTNHADKNLRNDPRLKIHCFHRLFLLFQPQAKRNGTVIIFKIYSV